MRNLRYGYAFILLLCLCAMPTLGASHQGIRFSARLPSDDGGTRSGFQFLIFYIYDNADRHGAALWTEGLPVEVGKNGDYTVNLGVGSPAFTEKVIESHPLLYISVRTVRSSKVSAAAVITTIPQGIWVDCNPDNSVGNCDGLSDVTSEGELRTISAARFRYVLNDSNLWGTQSQIALWASQARASSLKIIWYIPSDFALYQDVSTDKYSLIANDTEFASSFCSGCTNAGFTTALVKWFASLPATAGYYIDDEYMNMASQGELQDYEGKNISEGTVKKDLATLSDTIRAADPDHEIYGAETWDSVNNATESQLARFLDPIAGALDVIGADYYPVGTGEAAGTEAWAAEWLSTIARGYGKSTFLNLQAFSWEDFAAGACESQSICVYPSASQLQSMLMGAAGIGKPPSMLVWFDYGDTVQNGQWVNFVSAVNPQ